MDATIAQQIGKRGVDVPTLVQPYLRWQLERVPEECPRRLNGGALCHRVMGALAPARRLWVALAGYTGGRLSEVERISSEYLDPANRRLLLPGTKTNKACR